MGAILNLIKRYLTVIILFTAFMGKAQVIYPPTIDSLVLWLSADSLSLSNDSVNQWQDVSGRGNDFSQAVLSYQPRLLEADSVLNNKPVVIFDGINDYLNGGDILDVGINSRSIFIIGRCNSSTGTYLAKSIYAAGNNRYALWYSSPDFYNFYIETADFGVTSARSSGRYEIITSLINRTNRTLKTFFNSNLSGTSINISDSGYDFNSPYRFLVGAYNDGSDNNGVMFLQGLIAEIIIYNKALSDSERLGVEQYLRYKYSPPINLGSDINITYGFCDTTISAGKNWFTSYLWNTGETTESISVSESGTYSVTVTDIFGFTSSDSIQVTYPELVFNVTDTTICKGDTVNISTNLSLLSNYTYLWNSGSASDSINVYEDSSISISVTDSNLCSIDSDTIQISIDNFSDLISLGEDVSVCSGNTISLDTYPDNPDSLFYNWLDYSTDSLLTIDTTGNYWVEVTNHRGCSGRDTLHVDIIGTAPSVYFSVLNVCDGFPVAFENTSELVYDSLLWDFGDGQTDTSYTVSHLYSEPSDYTVGLTLYSGICSNTVFNTVTVHPNPIADFSSSSSCAGYPVEFSNLSLGNGSGVITSYLWTFDTLGISNSEDTMFSFLIVGDYEVSLEITSSNGCSDSISKEITTVSTTTLANIFLASPLANSTLSNSNISFNWISENSVQNILEVSLDSFSTILFSKTTLADNFDTLLSLSNNQKVYWRVKTYNYCYEENISDIWEFTYYSLSEIQGINLWLDASNGVLYDGSNEVEYWINLADTTDTVYQNALALRPDYVSTNALINNQPCLLFDGVDDVLLNDNVHQIGSAYVVARWSGTETFFPIEYGGILNANIIKTPFNYIFLGNKETSQLYTGSTPWNSSGNIFINNIATTEYSPINQYKILCGKTLNPQSLEGFVVGSADPTWGFWKGEVAELIVFDSVLTDSVNDEIINYLRYKYSPPINLGSDINITYGFCDTTISAGKNWFTNYLWSTGETTESISVTESGTYSVTVTDIFGFYSSDSVYVRFPEYNSISSQSICLGDTLQWNLNLGTDYTYLWQNSDTLPYFNVSDEGYYFAKITDTTSNHCFIYTDSVFFDVDSFSVQLSLGSDTSICSGNSIQLISGNETATSYLWSTGDTTQSIQIQNSGTYFVTIENSIGCVGHSSVNINIQGIAPNANFIFGNTCVGNSITFTDSSYTTDGSNIINWEWNLNNSNFYSQNINYTFSDTGYYAVSLTIANDSNCSEIITKNLFVNSLPSVLFSPLIGCSNKNISFTNLTTTAHGTVITNLWQFNNDSIISSYNFEYSFENEGTNILKLISTTSLGCTDSLEQNIDVKLSPQTNFSYSPPCEDQFVYFYDETETPVWLGITGYLWTFSNSVSSTSSSPSIVFDTTGIYSVTLTTFANNGCSNTLSKNIIVNQKPHAQFSNLEACVSNNHTFIDSSYISQGVISNWKWNIETGGTILSQNASFFPLDTGIFDVQLIAYSESGCSDTIQKEYSVNSLPIIDFSFSPTFGAKPLTVTFENLSSNATSYLWDFNDGETDAIFEPVHTFFDSTEYRIKLYGWTENQCLDSLSKSLFVTSLYNDIAVLNTQILIENEYASINTTIGNFGTLPISNFDIFIDIEGLSNYKEIWNGDLNPGEIINVTLATQYKIIDNQTPTYVCVKADYSDGSVDFVPHNNEYCYIAEQKFKMFNPYPNPTQSEISLSYLLPFDNNVLIQFYSDLGQLLYQQEFDGKAGLNRTSFIISTFSDGEYFVRLTFENDIVTTSFIKNTLKD